MAETKANKLNTYRVTTKLNGVVESLGVYMTTLSKKEFDKILNDYDKQFDYWLAHKDDVPACPTLEYYLGQQNTFIMRVD
jgi:hypothetical protein